MLKRPAFPNVPSGSFDCVLLSLTFPLPPIAGLTLIVPELPLTLTETLNEGAISIFSPDKYGTFFPNINEPLIALKGVKSKDGVL